LAASNAYFVLGFVLLKNSPPENWQRHCARPSFTTRRKSEFSEDCFRLRAAVDENPDTAMDALWQVTVEGAREFIETNWGGPD
jgi:hypothetical protein